MKKMMIFLIAISIGCVSYSGEKASDVRFQGLWVGSVDDENGIIDVTLELDVYNNTVKGKFKILNAPDYEGTMTYEIVNGELLGNKVKFIVPITGEIDDDALEVELELDNPFLVGSLQEMRPGSEKNPIFLKR